MDRVSIALLRGICQLPAYVAHEQGLFAEHEIESHLEILPTAWVVPERLLRGDFQFAVMPWTRVAAASSRGEDLVVICGSGHEEAAIVVRQGLDLNDVQTLAVPQEGGIKDLTAQALVQSLGWHNRRKLRMPSGDGAILAFVGQAADAASMVEPYATMLVEQGLGTVVRRTGDLWPGAPGCSLTTTRRMIDEQPDLVRRVVAAFVQGATATHRHPATAAAIAEPYIGVHQRHILAALANNQPRVESLHSRAAMDAILSLMHNLGYLDFPPGNFLELSFLRETSATAQQSQAAIASV